MSKESREKADEKGQKSGKQSSIISYSKRYLLTMSSDYDMIKSAVLLIVAIMFTGLSLVAIPYSLLYSGICILIALTFSTYAVSNL